MFRMSPVKSKLGEFIKSLQALVDHGTPSETVVHVYNADMQSYQPVSIITYGNGTAKLSADEDYDTEIGRWQREIKTLLQRECCKEVDGTGCESGDPLDVTLAEISQAIGIIRERKGQGN